MLDSFEKMYLGASSMYVYLAALLVASYGLLVNYSQFFADDPGVGWHLETGRLIADTQQILRVDPFLFAVQPRQWISDQWGADLFLLLLDSLGGWPLLYAVGVFVFLLVYFVIVPRVCRQIRASAAAISLATLLCCGLGLCHFVLRPVLLGNLFLL